MTLYEHIFVARPDLTTAQVDALTEQFTKALTDLDGVVVKTEYCGLRTLAYEIRKNRKGHYVLLNLKASPKALHEMERIMGLNEDLLRFLTVKVTKHEEGSSILLQQSKQSDYGDRPREYGNREFGSRDQGFRPNRHREDKDIVLKSELEVASA
jgi:small subunit ribosomal protein S6